MFLQVYKYFFCSKTNRRSLLRVEFGNCIGRESSNVLLFIQDISPLLIVSNARLIHNNQLPLTKFGIKHVGIVQSNRRSNLRFDKTTPWQMYKQSRSTAVCQPNYFLIYNFIDRCKNSNKVYTYMGFFLDVIRLSLLCFNVSSAACLLSITPVSPSCYKETNRNLEIRGRDFKNRF